MQLEHAIIALWVLCSMFACWFFSLIIRWFSDRRARRRDRLKSQYSYRSKWIAGILMMLCVLGSGVAGASAHLISEQPNIGGVSLTPVGAIGLGMLLFASFLAVWVGIGDRSRGRLRCPRCWYDMSDSNGLPCPECGCEIEHEKQLIRTRRPRWVLVIASVFVVLGATGLGINNKLVKQGAAGFVPSRMLLQNWERMPKSWVYDNGIGRAQNNLVTRLRLGEVSNKDRRAFAEQLIDEMIEDPLKRWEPRRMILLDAIHYLELYDQEFIEAQLPVWVPSEDRVQHLYNACVQDILLYLQRETDPLDMDFEFQLTDALLANYGSTHATARRWLLTQEFDRPQTYYSFSRGLSAEQVTFLQSHLDMIPSTLLGMNNSSLYWDLDTERMLELMQIETEIGVLSQRVPDLLDWYEKNQHEPNNYFLHCISNGMLTIPPDDRAGLLEQLRRWISDGDLELRAAALRIVSSVYGYAYSPPRLINTPVIDELISDIQVYSLTDTRSLRTRSGERWIARYAWDAIVIIDATGEDAFTMILEGLMNPGTRDDALRYSDLNLGPEYPERLENWIEVYEPLLTHQDARVRLWLTRQIPTTLGTQHDDQLNAMLDILIEDQSPDVSDEAWVKALNRQHR